MRITMNLNDYEINLIKDALMSRKEELRLMAIEDKEDGNDELYMHHMTAKTNCAILYDYLSDLAKIG